MTTSTKPATRKEFWCAACCAAERPKMLSECEIRGPFDDQMDCERCGQKSDLAMVIPGGQA